MSYKRVVTKNGKVYGPYIYESYRDENGNVKKRYLGKKEEKRILPFVNIFLITIFFILFLVGIGYTTDYYFNNGKFFTGLTGFTVDDTEDSSNQPSEDLAAQSTEAQENQPTEELPEQDLAPQQDDQQIEPSSDQQIEESLDEDSPNQQVEELSEDQQQENQPAEDQQTIQPEETIEIPNSNQSFEEEQNVSDIAEEVNESFENITEEIVENQNQTNQTISNQTIVTITPNLNQTLINETLINQTQTNQTLINQTQTNQTPINETIINQTLLNLSAPKTLQYKAVIGRPVKWIKKVNVSKGNLSIEIPKKAVNISVLTDEEVEEAEKKIEDFKDLVEEVDRKDLAKGVILTGNVVVDLSESKGILTKFWEWITGFSITGEVVLEEDLENSGNIIVLENITIVDVENVANETSATEIAVEYYTEAPIANESLISNGKRVVVSAPSILNYTDILAYALIEGEIKMNDSGLRIYWYEDVEDSNVSIEDLLVGGSNASGKVVDFVQTDFDSDGFVDMVEWVVPHLSSQVYEIIYITKAEHLDSNRAFVEDIYDDVKALDGNWSKTIGDGEYVRVTFEVPLDNSKDITLYPRVVNGTPRIEVYEKDGFELITEFISLIEGENKVYLTGLVRTQDVFDLRVIDGSVEFDYIVDPIPSNISARISSISNTVADDLNGYCNATDADGDDLAYDYIWYNDSSVYFNGILFRNTIAAGGYHVCGIRANDSRVLCWGNNDYGQLGDGSNGTDSLNPTLIVDASAYTSLSGGGFSTCGIRLNDSRVLCWGRNDDGQIGNGSSGDGLTPTLTSDSDAYMVLTNGYFHTCGIRANDSRVLCWGRDEDGQLGDGVANITDSLTPTLTTDTNAYTFLSAGAYHTCGIRANDSRVLCWGQDSLGQLGDGSGGADNPTPTLTTDNSAYTSLFAGAYHTCGIRANDSRVLCWGDNNEGQLGDGLTGGDNPNPSLTTDTSAYIVLTGGFRHTCGVRSNDSRVLCWGRNSDGQLGSGIIGGNDSDPSLTTDTGPYAILTSGDYYTCGTRTNDSRVLCWGDNTYGQLGDGSNGTDSPDPNLITDTSEYAFGFAEGEDVLVSILGSGFLSVGDNWTFSCRAYDFVNYSSWGNSSVLEILDDAPVMVTSRIYSASNSTSDNLMGYCNATDVEGDDLVYDYVWYNGSTVYSNGTLFRRASIVGGEAHTCGIRSNDSRVLCWGDNTYGQLGNGSLGGNNSNPNLTVDSSAYMSLSAGLYHTCGIRSNDSRVLCWGRDHLEQLGNGAPSSDNPIPATTTDSSSYTDLSSGLYHTCGIRSNDSRVLCWGYDYDGQLGDGVTNPNSISPNLTIDSDAYMSIFAGSSHTCGIRSNDSRVLCWGDNTYGQLGNGSAGSSNPIPTLTADSSAYIFLALGDDHTCGIRSNDSRVLCWGGDSDGALGDGVAGNNTLVPTSTVDSSAYTFLATGHYHTCGIRSNDSRVLCWGWDANGQLGDGTVNVANNPVPNLTVDSSAYVSLVSGEHHTCGIRSNDSRVLCWGWDANGQLGDGSLEPDNPVPSLTVDSSAYGSGFIEGEDILVSVLGSSFLSVGDNWIFSCRAYDFSDYSSWLNSSSLSITSAIPNNVTPTLVSVDGLNLTSSNLNCSGVLIDDNGDNLNVSVRWYKDSVLNLTVDYNNSYANGTEFDAILNSGNTSKGENWSCSVRVDDGSAFSGWGNSSNLTILNSLPVVTLLSPTNWNSTTNRSLELTWDGVDDDGDGMIYEYFIEEVGGVSCDELRSDNSVSDEFYVPLPDWKCLYDNGFYYNWSVRASDDGGSTWGTWSPIWHFNITAVVSLVLASGNISFGTMIPGDLENTTDNSPAPFVIENNGNSVVNVSLNSSALWSEAPGDSSYYRSKVDNVSGEEGAFNWILSLVDWFNVSINGYTIAVANLNYSDSADSVEIDVLLEAPGNEIPGTKEATIIFKGELAE